MTTPDTASVRPITGKLIPDNGNEVSFGMFVPESALAAERAAHEATRRELARITADRGAKTKRMWELGAAAEQAERQCEQLRERQNMVAKLLVDLRVNSTHPRHLQWRQECDDWLAGGNNGS